MGRKGITALVIASFFVTLDLGPREVPSGMAATYTPPPIGQVQGEGTLVHNAQRIAVRANTVPLFSGGQVYTAARAARIWLADGSQLDLLPYGSVAIQVGKAGLEAHVDGGRIVFQMGSESHLALITPTARLESMGEGVKRGELFVDPYGVSALRMAEGMLRTVAGDSNRVLVASTEPVFIPRKPAIEGPLFLAQLIAPAPRLPQGATALFDPSGKNIGYLTSEGTFVSAPGTVPDLAAPIPDAILEKVLPDLSAGATPAFTREGKYVGYLQAGTFARIAPSRGPSSTTRMVSALLVNSLAVGIPTGLGVFGSADEAPATPVSP